MSGRVDRLAVYGSLAPGRPNHHQLAGLSGRWIEGTVRGDLVEEVCGSVYPGMVLDPDAPPVTVKVLESPDLPSHWARLDAFEGDAYQRTATLVTTSEGEIEAWIYELEELHE